MTVNRIGKRKALQPSKSIIKRPSEVITLRIENMTIKTKGGSTLHFKRLKYKACPRINTVTLDFDPEVALIDMHRDSFIRECYQLLASSVTQTTSNHFSALVSYLKWSDETEQVVPESGYMDSMLVRAYMDWCMQQHKLGKLTTARFSNRKGFISWMLRQTNRKDEASRLPIIKGVKENTTPHPSLDLETEFKPTIKALFRAYKAFLTHFDEGTVPQRHPLYDEALVESEAVTRDLKGKGLGVHRAAFKTVLTKSHPNKHFTDCAMMLTYMFTGMNTAPLAQMKISDVKFREVQGGKYIFDSEKGRAAHQEQDNALGFSRYAKQFIEGWIDISKRMANGDEGAYLFPFVRPDGSTISYSETSVSTQHSINKLLSRMGLTRITPSILRKTKSDTLYRVTESVYLVAISNNNSIATTSRAYIHGTKKEHQNNLSAAMSAKHAMVKGKNVTAAAEEAKFNHGDILDDYEYQRLRMGKDRTHEARTPTGARCNDSRQGAASFINKALKKAGVNADDSEVACTDFLSCFGCQHHSFVTDVDDIWLMLSFKETLQQLQQTPSVNSMPDRKYTDLYNDVESVLQGFKTKNRENYDQALEKLKDAPHPLYSTVYSLNDLLEIFG